MNFLKRFFKGFRKGVLTFGELISLLLNSALLLIVYIFGVGLTAIFAKMCRKKFIETRISEEKDSYWEDLDLGKNPIDSYYKQF